MQLNENVKQKTERKVIQMICIFLFRRNQLTIGNEYKPKVYQ